MPRLERKTGLLRRKLKLPSFMKSAEKEARDPKARRNTLRFLAVFAAVFLAFVLIINPLLDGAWSGLEVWHAQAAAELLRVFGIDAQVGGNTLAVDIQGHPVDFVISRLCSGDVEVALLVALLIASLDVLLFWRIAGAVVGALAILLLNPVRIAVTVWITSGTGLEAGDIAHTVIFRLFLFLLLVSYYFAWYRLCKGRAIPITWKS